MSSTHQQHDKGKGRARQDRQDRDGGDHEHAGQSSQSPFEPERPRQVPRTSSRQSQNDAKTRLVRKSPQPPAQEQEPDQQSSQQTGPSSGSEEKGNAGTEQNGQGQDVSSSHSMQRLPSTGSYYQMVRQPPRLRIREDVSKSTSFDRARDGDLLYDLWVGPP